MDVALIVAMAENGVIGRNNKLPWHLPEDLRYFKQTTMGKPIIMGRKTYESIGKPLPGRTNIVISRQENYELPEGAKHVRSLDEAIELADSIAFIDGTEEVMVIGGSQIYKEAFLQGKADRLYLTKVHSEVDGDAYLEGFDESQWRLTGQDDFQSSETNPYDYSFCVYERA